MIEDWAVNPLRIFLFLLNECYILYDFFERFRKTRLTGFYVICFYLIIGYFIGFSISSAKETERVFQLLNFLILGFGIAIVLLPNIIGFTNVKNLYYYEYSDAHSTVIHNCTAYVNMENMEPWKQYMEEVKKQGRQLTNHECNLIINDWNNLIK